MDSLISIVQDIRNFIYGGMVTLPLTISGTMLILGLFTANYAILFFLIGFLIITPCVSTMINLGIGKMLSPESRLFMAKTTDICKIYVPYSYITKPHNPTPENVISSPWVAMVSFFMGYIFTNGIQLYNRNITESTLKIKTDSSSDLDSKVTNRKSQAIISIVSVVAFSICALGYRYYSGCESAVGMIPTSIVFILLGVGWYKALSSIGEDRLSDLFGIANRLLPPSAITNGPIACVPVRA